MSDGAIVDPRAELSAIAEDTRRHLEWLRDAGIRQLKRETALPVVAPAPAPQVSPIQAKSARPRAAFELESAPPPAPPPTAARPPMPASPAPMSAPPPVGDPARALQVIREDLGDCHRCPLGQTRTKLVFGQGNPHAEVLFLGEAPGEDEDLSGLAFVGKAGQLLTKMIEAMGFTRDDVYICNINKCRPPENRKPLPNEVEACRPFVERQIKAIRPKVIVALGATATQSLLRIDAPISRMRNKWTSWEGVPVMPTFHPSYLLRVPGEKAKAWDDLKLVLAKLGREAPKRGGA